MGLFDFNYKIYVVIDQYDDVEWAIPAGEDAKMHFQNLIEDLSSPREFVKIGEHIINKKFIVEAFITK